MSILNFQNVSKNKLLSDPFYVESYRDYLAETNQSVRFKRMYNLKYASIPDANSEVFWNKKIAEVSHKDELSPIAKDKNKIVSREVVKIGGRILDIGFGYGYLERYLGRERKLSLFGIDKSAIAVKQIRKSNRGVYKRATVTNIPFRDNFFDITVALDVLEHIPPSQTFQALSEVYRVTRPRGCFVVSVPLNEGLDKLLEKGKNPNGHVRAYTKRILERELLITGFSSIKIQTLSAFSDGYLLKKLAVKLFPFLSRQPNLLIAICSKT